MATTSLGFRTGGLGTLAYNNFLLTDKFRFKMWFAIFKKHFKDLAKIFA
jgi:hypothetical protein